MENDIATAAASYVLIRITVLLGFGYLFYRVLKPARAVARRGPARATDIKRSYAVPDDRC